MLNIALGILLFIFGAWGVFANWMMFLDTFKMILFLCLIGFGIVAILAGIRQTKKKK